MGTQTPKLGLFKPSITPPEVAWAAEFEAGFDRADTRLTLSGAGNPNGHTAGFWVGQQYWDTIINQFWACVGPDSNPAAAAWVLPGAINQTSYDVYWAIGTCILQRGTLAGTPPIVPPGVTATWLRHGHPGFLKSSGLGIPSEGGSNAGEQTFNSGAHQGGVNIPVAHATAKIGDITIGPDEPLTVVTAVGNAAGLADAIGDHSHAIDLVHLDVVVWERTA